MLEKGF